MKRAFYTVLLLICCFGLVGAAGVGFYSWTAQTQAIVGTDLVGITDTSDTSQSDNGSSKKATMTQVGTFMGTLFYTQSQIDGMLPTKASLGLDTDDNVVFNTVSAIGANSLAIGTAQSNDGKIIVRNGTNTNLFSIIASAFSSTFGWIWPTGPATVDNSLLAVDIDGTMHYTDPATMGGGTDDQGITEFTLTGDNLTITLEDDAGGQKTVDLSGYTDAEVSSGACSGDDLVLTLSDASTVTVTDGCLTGSGGSDADAIHDNVGSEISAITEKASPVSADMIIIEDSEAANAKKMVQVGNLPGGSGTTTALSVGTVGTTTVGITSENATDDVILPAATNSTAGVATAAQITTLETVAARVADGVDGGFGFSSDNNTVSPTPATGYDTWIGSYLNNPSFYADSTLSRLQIWSANLDSWSAIAPSAKQNTLTNPVVQANFGTGVYTFLGTPTVANFFSAVTGEGAFAATLLGYADAAAVLSGIGAQAALTNPIVRADLDTTPADDDTVPPSSGALYDHTTNTSIHVTKISGTSTMGTAEIASGACATTVTTTATGASTTDVISGNFNASPLAVTGYAASASGGLFIYAWPTANNVNFSVCNNTAAPITPGSAVTLNWQIIK